MLIRVNKFSPNLCVRLNILASEESDPGEADVLMFDQHVNRDKVGHTHVVNEPRQVPILASINAVRLSILQKQQNGFIWAPHLCLGLKGKKFSFIFHEKNFKQTDKLSPDESNMNVEGTTSHSVWNGWNGW